MITLTLRFLNLNLSFQREKCVRERERMSVLMFVRRFHGSTVCLKRSSFFRGMRRRNRQVEEIVEDEKIVEDETSFGSLGLDEELLRQGSASEVKEHLRKLQHDFPMGYEHFNPVKNEIIRNREPERRQSRTLDKKRRSSAAMIEGRDALNMYHHSRPITPRGMLKGLNLSRIKKSSNKKDTESGVSDEAEVLRRNQQRREFRVLDILRCAVEEGHVRHTGLRPRGVPIEFLNAKTTKCMTKYTIEWTLPSEIEDDSLMSCWASCDTSTISLDPKQIQIEASRALEKSAGRFRVFMQQSARLRKPPRLEFKYTQPVQDDDGVNRRENSSGSTCGSEIEKMLMEIQREIDRDDKNNNS